MDRRADRQRGARRLSVVRPVAAALLVAAVTFCLGAVGHGQQRDGGGAPPGASMPETGGPRILWPQRPGAARPLAIPPLTPAPPVPPQAALDEPQFVPNQVLVQFVADSPEAARAAARAAVGAGPGRRLSPSVPDLELLTTTLAVPEAIAALQALPGIEFAEPNWIVRHTATSNDPFFVDGSLYGMYGDGSSPANPFGSQAAEAWAKGFTGSSSVYVAVIDEGIDVNHPDLAANIWTNPFDPVDGIDNDGNGRIDDVNGWDFFNDDSSVYDGSPADPDMDSHGTHVAGTIGAVGGNGVGVAGVNWNVSLISAKFLGPLGGTTAGAIQALQYVTDLKTRHGLNIVATNNSWGGAGYSEALHQAIIKAAKQDILFIVAAGNSSSNNDSIARYPSNYSTDVSAGSESAADYDAVIAVASITDAGVLSSFSNYGATTVDIGAPGSSILSTYPQDNYAFLSGTSMATPHVSGAAALYRSINTGKSAADIRTALMAQALITSSLSGITTTGKRVNVGDFVKETDLDLSIDDIRIREGQSGSTSASFALSLSKASPANVMVSYGTIDLEAVDGVATTAANAAAITIPSSGNASPYPSSITVGTGLGTIRKVTVKLHGFTHTKPSDVDILLVGPGGQSVVLISDVGAGGAASNLTLTFDDAGVEPPASGTALWSGTFRPTNRVASEAFIGPAPGGPYGATLATFGGTDPAGTWRLFVTDDLGEGSGTISGGWSLILDTSAEADYSSSSATLMIPAGATSQTLNITVHGDQIREESERFTVVLFSASGAHIADRAGVGTIVNDDFTDPTLTGSLIKAVHVLELRTAINDARAARQLEPFGFTDADLTPQKTSIRAVHLTELQTALAQAYVAAKKQPPAFTDIIPGVIISALHITELRAAVAALE